METEHPLSAAVREAAEAFNKAVMEATEAGMVVQAELRQERWVGFEYPRPKLVAVPCWPVS